MKKNFKFITYYIKILTCIINNKYKPSKLGRPRKYSNEIYIKHIIDFIIDGSSWNKLKRTVPYADSIRKMFNKWYNDSIFYYAYLVVNRQYNKKNKNITNYYIDSTSIQNKFMKTELMSYGYKYKNKLSIKLDAVCDDNYFIHYIGLSKGSQYDSKSLDYIIPQFNKQIKNKNNINFIGDKGYIKNNKVRNEYKDNYKVNLLTPTRINSKNNIIDDEEIKLLNNRKKIENCFNAIKNGYTKINFPSGNTKNYLQYIYITIALYNLSKISNI